MKRFILWSIVLAATALVAMLVARIGITRYYYPESVGITMEEKGSDLEIQFDVVERGKFYDCPAIHVAKSKKRIDLMFVLQDAGRVRHPMDSITITNPERLPVFITGRGKERQIWADAELDE